MTIIWCMVPEIWRATGRIFCHSGQFFVLYAPSPPSHGPRKSKFWKTDKNARRYHFTHVYHKWKSYDVWFLRYEAWWTYPLKTQKIKILKKWKKKSGDIIILHMCTRNNNHMLYHSWDVKCGEQNFLSFWTVFCHFNPKNQNLEKMKKKPGDIIILHKCTINDNQMMYGFWYIEHNRQISLPFWTIFCPFAHLTTQNIKILKKLK